MYRIDSGRFGYCEITGEPIGLKRLEALPFTHLSMEALMEKEPWH
ncbi:MAG: TraR/DksA C4-type zinc finger protein [Proteobacteria bacterium]|nr:TraR/DksA C4-type zinc finger protein [Pseudomonadota bacterium]